MGCAGLELPAGAPAEIKRLWVSPRSGGLGLARRLLSGLESGLEARAARHGRDRVRLDTNKALEAAMRLCRDSGYTEVPAFNDEPMPTTGSRSCCETRTQRTQPQRRPELMQPTACFISRWGIALMKSPWSVMGLCSDSGKLSTAKALLPARPL